MLIGQNGPVDPSTLDPDLGSVTMYCGEVRVAFDPLAHRYVVSDVSRDGGKPFSPPSVTRVLGAMIDKSEPLTAWAGKCAQAKMLELLQPGRAYSAEELTTIGYYVKDAHKNVVKTACDVGHETHSWIERYLIARAGRGDYPAPPSVDMPTVRSACSAARKFILENDIKPVGVERIFYHRMGVIGTCDLAGSIALVNGCLSICDWKSSNSIEGHNYEWQLAAYSKMYEAMTGVPVPGRVVVRLDKENSTAYPKVLPAEKLEADWAAFQGLLVAYKRLKEMEMI